MLARDNSCATIPDDLKFVKVAQNLKYLKILQKNREISSFLRAQKLVKLAKYQPMRSFLSCLKFMKITKNRPISSSLSGLKFAKIAKNREAGSFLCASQIHAIGKYRAISSFFSTFRFLIISQNGALNSFLSDHKIRGHFTCQSSDVVYCMSCNRYPTILYIGETGRSLGSRFSEHLRSIRNNTPGLPVVQHFNSTGHSFSDIRVQGI